MRSENGVGDYFGHVENNAQPRILQNEIFHETAHVHDACNMDVAYGRQIFVHSGSGFDGAAAQLDMADAGRLAETSVNGDDVRMMI